MKDIDLEQTSSLDLYIYYVYVNYYKNDKFIGVHVSIPSTLIWVEKVIHVNVQRIVLLISQHLTLKFLINFFNQWLLILHSLLRAVFQWSFHIWKVLWCLWASHLCLELCTLFAVFVVRSDTFTLELNSTTDTDIDIILNS